jgi:hypothetical protein
MSDATTSINNLLIGAFILFEVGPHIGNEEWILFDISVRI